MGEGGGGKPGLKGTEAGVGGSYPISFPHFKGALSWLFTFLLLLFFLQNYLSNFIEGTKTRTLVYKSKEDQDALQIANLVEHKRTAYEASATTECDGV